MIKKYFLLALATGWLLISCKKDSELPASPTLAYLMVYNGVPDFYGANSMVLVNNAPYGPRSYNDNGNGLVGAFNFSKYTYTDTGVFKIGFTDTTNLPDNARKISETLLKFENRQHYTLYLLDSLGFYEIRYTHDDVQPDPDHAKIRLVHLTPDMGAVYMKIDTTTIDAIKNIAFRGVSNYATVSPGPKPAIRIMYQDETTGEERTLVRKSVPLEPGRCYTVILRGYRQPVDGNVNKTINLSTITNF
ncbi:DUF4397 domain-containing protein [Chitinophaga sp. RCC_12]|uniref:DUF4397 domain-containing protein n=1 Tax=Chitinophaga sp. RCC_12 TaxID=3239226 RepID=UPI003523D97B